MNIHTGQQIRLASIPADVGAGFGIFERIPPEFKDSFRFVEYLKTVNSSFGYLSSQRARAID